MPTRRPAAAGPDARTGVQLTLWDAAALLLLLALTLLVLRTFGEYGISNDEEVQHVYGRKLLAFYLSGFADRSAFEFSNLYLYGGLFDLVVAGLERLLPGVDPWNMRHLLCGLTGVLGIAGVWAVGRRFGGPRAGLLAAALLTVCGVWYGGMFNNTKDVPFATAMIWSVYLLARVLDRLPAPPWRLVLGFGLVAGLALGLRVGALLLVGYAAAGVLCWALLQGPRPWPRNAGAVAAIAFRLLPAALLAYAVMGFFWPWAVQELPNPVRALSAFSHFRYPVGTVLDGKEMPMFAVPRTYLPVYLAIKLPLLLWAGVLAWAAALLYRARHGRPLFEAASRGAGDDRPAMLAVALAAGFPIAYAVATRPPLYDGLRHFLFVVPPLAALAGLGLDAALRWAARRTHLPAGALAGLLGLAVGMQAFTMVRLHPYEYVYYNGLVGGLPGADQRYVMDYWANSVPEATRMLADYLKAQNGGRPVGRVYNVGVCAERRTFEHVAPPFMRWVKDWGKADFYIAPTHMDCDNVMHGRAIAVVRRLGVTLAVVEDMRLRPYP